MDISIVKNVFLYLGAVTKRRHISSAQKDTVNKEIHINLDNVISLLNRSESNQESKEMKIERPIHKKRRRTQNVMFMNNNLNDKIQADVSHTVLEDLLSGSSSNSQIFTSPGDEINSSSIGLVILRIKELETLLYISERKMYDCQQENRKLKREISHIKSSDKVFDRISQIKEKDNVDTQNNEEIPEAYNSEQDEATFEKMAQFAHSKVDFLTGINVKLEKTVENLQLLLEQEQHYRLETEEENQCLIREARDSEHRCIKFKQLADEHSRDNEYLERDIAYLRQKLKTENVRAYDHDDIQEITESVVEMKLRTERNNLESDLRTLQIEKKNFIDEIDVLHYRLHISDTEKKFSQQEAADYESKFKEIVKKSTITCPTCTLRTTDNTDLCSKNIEEKDKTTTIINVIANPKHCSLVKERDNTKELDGLRRENANMASSIRNLCLELEALRSANSRLDQQLKETEDALETANKNQNKKHHRESLQQVHTIEERVKAIGLLDDASIVHEEVAAIKEDVVLIAQENIEIRESNNLLLKRNIKLRRESIASMSMEKQTALLKTRIAALEDENEVLKLENLKVHQRHSDSPSPDLAVHSSKRYSSTTCQTKTYIDLVEDELDIRIKIYEEEKTSNVAQIDELLIVRDDLLKRNANLKIKLYDQENIASAEQAGKVNIEERYNILQTENNTLKRELRFLKTFTSCSQSNDRTDNAKYTNICDINIDNDYAMIDVKKMNDRSDVTTLELTESNSTNDFLRDYKIIELEEENKALMYANSILKQEIVKKEALIEYNQHQLTDLKESLREVSTLSELHETPQLTSKTNNANVEKKQNESKGSKDLNELLHSAKAEIILLKNNIRSLETQVNEYRKLTQVLQQQIFIIDSSETATSDRKKSVEALNELKQVQSFLESPIVEAPNEEEDKKSEDSFSLPSFKGDDLLSDFELEDIFKQYNLRNMNSTSSSNEEEDEKLVEENGHIQMTVGDIRDESVDLYDFPRIRNTSFVESKTVEARYDKMDIEECERKIFQLSRTIMQLKETISIQEKYYKEQEISHENLLREFNEHKEKATRQPYVIQQLERDNGKCMQEIKYHNQDIQSTDKSIQGRKL